MNEINATYPSFLKNEPLIWGVSISDLFRLSGVMVVMQMLGASQIVILGSTLISYLGIITARRIFPRRYFEFVWKRKKLIKRNELNAKNKIL